ncbi:MAG TPA: hypothetical protein VFQ41_01645 [Candidatus Angelobacter sp.]|nr:hypothetical protein [Candidatus Angelobacter sp.]
MKRREFINRAGMTAIALGLTGCTSNDKQTQSQTPTPTPTSNRALSKSTVRTDAPCLSTDAPLDKAELQRRCRIMMLFMLGFSQRSDGPKCVQIMEDIFPDDGNLKVSDSRMQAWGFDPAVFKAVVQNVKDNTTFAPKEIRERFANVHDIFDSVVSYTGSECPGRGSLNSIVTHALKQDKQ